MNTVLALMILLAATPGSNHDTAYAIRIEGQPVYRHTIFLGIGVDIKRRNTEPDDHLAGAVIALQQALQKNCSQQIDEPLLLKERATATAVTHALQELANPNRVHPDDRVIVDLVCHGDDTPTPRLFLAPERSGGSPSELTMATLRRLFLAIPARHKLLIVDGCRAGAMLKGGGRFDGASDARGVRRQPCSVIWSSSQSGANAQSEPGGTVFHNRLIEALGKGIVYGQTVLLSRVVDRVERHLAPAASFGAPNADLILAGPESKQAPPIDPKLGREEPLPADAEGARRRWKRLGEQEKSSTTPEQAELLRERLLALQQFKTADIESELDGALDEGDRALIVFTLADHPEEYLEIHRSLAYLCTAVGEWKPDKGRLSMALAHRRRVVDVLVRGEGGVQGRVGRVSLGNVLVDLADTEEGAGELGDTEAARDAPVRYRQALAMFNRNTDPADWARTQHNLGNALERLGERGDLSALKEAIEHYKLALQVYTRAADPAHWASTQNNLGNALATLGERGDLSALKEAVERYKLALQIYTRAADPAHWAATQNNLGNALERLGERGDLSALKEAVDHYKLALEVRTIDTDPAGCAESEQGLGSSLKALRQKAEAALAFRSAAQAYRRSGQSERAEAMDKEADALK